LVDAVTSEKEEEVKRTIRELIDKYRKLLREIEELEKRVKGAKKW